MENVDSIINPALENTHTILNFEVTSLQPLEDADTSFTIYSNPIDDVQQKAAEEQHNGISEQENDTGKEVSSISGGDIKCPVYIESVTAESSIEAEGHIEDSSGNYRGQAQIQLSSSPPKDVGVEQPLDLESPIKICSASLLLLPTSPTDSILLSVEEFVNDIKETPPSLNILRSPFKTGGKCDYKVSFGSTSQTRSYCPSAECFSDPTSPSLEVLDPMQKCDFKLVTNGGNSGFAAIDDAKECHLPVFSPVPLSLSSILDVCNHVTPPADPSYRLFEDANSCIIPSINRSSTPLLAPTNEIVAPFMSSTENNVKDSGQSKQGLIDSSAESLDQVNSSPSLKRLREDSNNYGPVPKRMTLASQKKQHQKLASPFRSPLVQKNNTGNVGNSRVDATTESTCIYSSDGERPKTLVHGPARSHPVTVPRAKTAANTPKRGIFSSAKASSPFKSPLMSSTTSTLSQVNNSRKIQELERKVQLLKRAIKIKKDNDEEKLEKLTEKWRNAGQEAAWELWSIVRENDDGSDVPYPGTNTKSAESSSLKDWGWASGEGNKVSSGSSWGWDEPSNGASGEQEDASEFPSPTKLENELFRSLKKPFTPRSTMLPPTPRGAYFERQMDSATDLTESGEDEGNEDGPPKPSKSLGTMLHQLGIAHHTLGWNEEEGDFLNPT